MIIFALAGLVSTACGFAFIGAGTIALIGIIPGALLIWISYAIWRANFGLPTDETSPEDSDHSEDSG